MKQYTRRQRARCFRPLLSCPRPIIARENRPSSSVPAAVAAIVVQHDDGAVVAAAAAAEQFLPNSRYLQQTVFRRPVDGQNARAKYITATEEKSCERSSRACRIGDL